MSRAPTKVTAKRSILRKLAEAKRTLREVYLSIFVLSFRITLGEAWMKFSRASGAVSLVSVFIAMTFLSGILVATDYCTDEGFLLSIPLGLVTAFISGAYLNRHGLKFEKQFRGFSRQKRIALYLAAVGVIAATGIAFGIIGLECREMYRELHLPRQ